MMNASLKKIELVVFESRLTHEGWAVISEGHVLQVFHVQRQADNVARDLAKLSVEKGQSAEIRLLKSDGKLRAKRKFDVARRSVKRRKLKQFAGA